MFMSRVNSIKRIASSCSCRCSLSAISCCTRRIVASSTGAARGDARRPARASSGSRCAAAVRARPAPASTASFAGLPATARAAARRGRRCHPAGADREAIAALTSPARWRSRRRRPARGSRPRPAPTPARCSTSAPGAARCDGRQLATSCTIVKSSSTSGGTHTPSSDRTSPSAVTSAAHAAHAARCSSTACRVGVIDLAVEIRDQRLLVVTRELDAHDAFPLS